MNISVAATNVSIDSKLHTLLAIEECSSTDVIAGDAQPSVELAMPMAWPPHTVVHDGASQLWLGQQRVSFHRTPSRLAASEPLAAPVARERRGPKLLCGGLCGGCLQQPCACRECS